MTINVASLTFDCEDPMATSSFWAAAIERSVDDGASPYFASIDYASADHQTWMFIKVPESKSVKNRMHLDFSSDDPGADVARLVALGATHVADKAEHGHAWSVLTDIEGNEFCVSTVHT